jgi:nitrogen fixation/metabolism regulation signal transduction histidine kinase
VRQARENYQSARAELAAAAAELAAAWQTAGDAEGARRAALAAAVAAHLGPADRAVLQEADGTTVVLRAGPPAPADTDASAGPPRFATAGAELGDGRRLELTRALATAWREDAALLADTLQMVNGLHLARGWLERSFTWLPILVAFLLAVGVGLVAAMRLGAGITEPVSRLVAGTEEVSAGRWDVQVPVARHDELGQLSEGFNAMVRTLDLQSRRLVDLQKMAGWREMARALAHEVKNPLTPIQLTVEEIRARYPGGDAEYEALLNECTRIVIEEVESLRAVVARFREFSRPVELVATPTDLGQLVRDVAALQRDLRVELRIARELEPVPADSDRLRQVLMNLAGNAREATQGVEEPRLDVTVAAEADHAVISLEDNGPGIPVDQRERVFEPYRTGKTGGLGLGLALVKGIVLAHGGTIAVDAGELGGARFTIRLPRRLAPMDEEQDHDG